ncbi:MAG TPA: uracil-DNA glycosylase family protein [Acidimicrobiales bacterium]|nr:uracil-DNA glycosylase family protein [Acidimicrobiales bacterium]
MEKATVDVYEARGTAWAARRRPVRRAHAKAFAKLVAQLAAQLGVEGAGPIAEAGPGPRGEPRAEHGHGPPRVDLGCGAGRYISDIGQPAIGIDAARAMLEQCRAVAPDATLVQGDLEALPFKSRSLYGGWANMSYLHLPGVRLPAALADLHRTLVVGAPVDLQVLAGEYEGDALPTDDVGGRFFCAWRPDHLCEVLTGAGFDVERMRVDGDVVRVRAVRLRTLPDYVGADMRLLVVGLNPSLFAADAGVGFARPGNRFWPAALSAGLVTRDRDPMHALHTRGIGMTDLVKKPTSRAAELTPSEYREGMARVELVARWLGPRVLCMVGLSGWRAAVDPRAQAGPQPQTIGGRPVYLMPSTSGANAHARSGELAEHLRAAAALGARAPHTSMGEGGGTEGPRTDAGGPDVV